ncbi:MAG: hypothetical protein GY725_08475 [bacterium]|nr:hypothetical protein [bacterium]
MAALQILVGVAYPALIYLGLRVLEPRQVALSVLGLLALRLAIAAPHRLIPYTKVFWLPVLAVGLMVMATAATNHPLSLLLGPSLINLALFAVFASSLVGAESTIERLARIQVPDLSREELAYCRRVNVIWSAFFVINGTIAFGLALAATLEAWALYTGGIAYVLMGVLFAAEFTYRHWRFRRYLGAPTDWVFRMLFGEDEQSDAVKPRLDPEFVSERTVEQGREFELRVPEDLACWPGHFPVYSLVPGVLQLRWVVQAVERCTGTPAFVRSIEALKFKRPMLPGQAFTLAVQPDETRRLFRFSLNAGTEVFSSGRLRVEFDEEGA